MNIQVFETYEELSQRAAEELVLIIQQKSDAVICLASGHSPQRACAIFVALAKQKKLNLSNVHFVGLDEWVGVNSEDPGSCHFFFHSNLIEPLEIPKSNCHLFNVSEEDLAAECSRMDNVIANLGGIDLMMVGIGMNGHIGFNEPGVPFERKSHVAELDQTTQEVGQKYFMDKKVLKRGITLGLSHLMEARKVILVANGVKKADVVARALGEPVSEQIPASILQTHPNSLILVDKEAASKLAENDKRLKNKTATK
jgi:glucosamine-6-phosphate isomerase